MDQYLWLFDLALALYSIGMVLCGAALRAPHGFAARAAWAVLPVACLVHAVSFLAQWYVLRIFPLHTLLGAFSLYGLLCFIGAVTFAMRANSVSVAFSLGAIPYATLLLAWVLRFQGVTIKAELPPLFLSVHLFTVMLSFAAFSLAAGAGILLLALERALKEKRFGLFWDSLPPLGVLDHHTWRYILVGFLALSVGIPIGVAGAPHAWGGKWFISGHMLSTLVVWVLYGGYLLARIRYGWRGRKLALFSVGGFVLTLVTFVFINMGKYVL